MYFQVLDKFFFYKEKTCKGGVYGTMMNWFIKDKKNWFKLIIVILKKNQRTNKKNTMNHFSFKSHVSFSNLGFKTLKLVVILF
jgi:hypothetical protein